MSDTSQSLADEFKSVLWRVHVSDNRLDAQPTASWVNKNRDGILEALRIAEIVLFPSKDQSIAIGDAAWSATIEPEDASDDWRRGDTLELAAGHAACEQILSLVQAQSQSSPRQAAPLEEPDIEMIDRPRDLFPKPETLADEFSKHYDNIHWVSSNGRRLLDALTRAEALPAHRTQTLDEIVDRLRKKTKGFAIVVDRDWVILKAYVQDGESARVYRASDMYAVVAAALAELEPAACVEGV
jgi:hypothetical protein